MATALDSLPSPSLPGALLAAEYWLRPERFFERCAPLGDRFLLRMPGLPPMVCVTSPTDVRAIFTGDQRALHFGEALKMLAPHELILGSTSITVKDDEPHLRDRRMLAPHFSAAALKTYEPAMIDKTRRAMQAWPIDSPVSFQALMMELTLEIIMGTVFGVTDPARLARLRAAVLDFVGVIGGPRFFAFSMWAVARGGRWDGRHRRLRAAMAAVDAIVVEEMALRRRAGAHDQPDILALLLRLQTEHGLEAMSDVAILEMVRTLLVAGYETTASTLGWIAERVTRHPEVLARLEASASQADDEYVDAVVTETMRVRPVAPFTSRLVVVPFELDGLQLPAGTLVTPFIWLVHRRRDVYRDPELFVPERFVGRRPDNYAWIPFGGGLRKCLGGPFAMLEMRTVLRTMLGQVGWVATDERDEPLGRRNVTIVPGRGATVILRRRLRAAA